MSIFVVLNNYFHDFSVALLFACLLVIGYVERKSRDSAYDEASSFLAEMYRWLRPVLIGAWAFIVIGGIFRTLTYADYEWSEAAGRGQITALIVKHILLISLVVWGLVLQRRLRHRLFAREGGAAI